MCTIYLFTVCVYSKPMIDLLVMLCAEYHLNPSGHTIELISTNKNHIKFKPNALIGTLEAEKVLLKPKGMEDKNKKTGPQMPEVKFWSLIISLKWSVFHLQINSIHLSRLDIFFNAMLNLSELLNISSHLMKTPTGSVSPLLFYHFY